MSGYPCTSLSLRASAGGTRPQRPYGGQPRFDAALRQPAARPATDRGPEHAAVAGAPDPRDGGAAARAPQRAARGRRAVGGTRRPRRLCARAAAHARGHMGERLPAWPRRALVPPRCCSRARAHGAACSRTHAPPRPRAARSSAAARALPSTPRRPRSPSSPSAPTSRPRTCRRPAPPPRACGCSTLPVPLPLPRSGPSTASPRATACASRWACSPRWTRPRSCPWCSRSVCRVCGVRGRKRRPLVRQRRLLARQRSAFHRLVMAFAGRRVPHPRRRAAAGLRRV